MFGPKKEEIVAEVVKQLRNEMDSVKSEYISRLTKQQREMEGALKEIRAMAETLKEASAKNAEILELLNSKQPGIAMNMKLRGDLDRLSAKIDAVEKKCNERIDELGADMAFSMHRPGSMDYPAERETDAYYLWR